MSQTPLSDGGRPKSEGLPATNPALIVPLAVNLAFSLLAMLITLSLGHGLHRHYYPSTILFTIQAAIPAAAAIVGLTVEARRYACAVASSYAMVLIFPGWIFGGRGIPGGDDGTGLAWIFYGGLVCLASFVLGIGTLVAAVRLRAKSLPPGQGLRAGSHAVRVVLYSIVVWLIVLVIFAWTHSVNP